MMSTVGENPKAGQIKGVGDPMRLRNGTNPSGQ